MPSHKDDIIINLSHIDVTYGSNRKILSDVSMTVSKNDFVAITGPNGGGKTTLLKVILKLIKPSRGTVAYYQDGIPAKRLPIGYLPQKSMMDLKFPITVRETVKSGLLKGIRQKFTPEEEERFQQTCSMMGITDYLDRPVGELSGGQLQRTLLGRALISRPKVVVLDEPLSYVDKQFERQIYSIMQQIASEATVILVSHEMTYISRMATKHLIVDRTLHECGATNHYFLPPECF